MSMQVVENAPEKRTQEYIYDRKRFKVTVQKHSVLSAARNKTRAGTERICAFYANHEKTPSRAACFGEKCAKKAKY